jgi:hypothetical protein
MYIYKGVVGLVLYRPLLYSIVVHPLMISWPEFTPGKCILSIGKPSIRVQRFKWMQILVSIMGTTCGINGVVEVLVSQTMLLEFMLMLKMVNLGANVDNGSIQVGWVA